MSKEAYKEINFRKNSLDRLWLINSILDEYAQEGYDLSLRQLYYQLVARGYIGNSDKSYNRLGDLVTKGRLAGLVDWAMITDRSRETVGNSHWESPAEIVQDAASSFAVDKWADQPTYVEVMVEKDALSGVLIPVCRELDIRFTANKGYPSASLMYDLAQRLRPPLYSGKDIVILHLGDHDPSGIDMTRDLEDRLQLFLGVGVQVKRLALNITQIEELKPPPNPAKTTDTRAAIYIARFGDASWELDAIEPRQLADLVIAATGKMRDSSLWDKAMERESIMRRELHEFAESYSNDNR